jgi:CheY-specific phosphatase CheX
MKTAEIEDALRTSSARILETMFFAETLPLPNAAVDHRNPVACLIHCSGAAEGIFSIAVDEAALRLLCCSFYGEDEPQLPQEHELICELTNMLAGSTLSALAPAHYCELSSPQICSFNRHRALCTSESPDLQTASTVIAIDGGLLTINCALRANA